MARWGKFTAIQAFFGPLPPCAPNREMARRVYSPGTHAVFEHWPALWRAGVSRRRLAISENSEKIQPTDLAKERSCAIMNIGIYLRHRRVPMPTAFACAIHPLPRGGEGKGEGTGHW